MAIDYSKILPELYVGTFPTSVQDIDRLKDDCTITAVLNLQTDADMNWHNLDWTNIEGYYRACKIEVWRMPIHDFNPKDLQSKLAQAVVTLNDLIRAGHRVYVHCTAGVNRSPTVVIAYMHKYRGYDLKTAAKMVQDFRTCEPYLDVIQSCKFE
jgi:protein-tyrosine phosphatase